MSFFFLSPKNCSCCLNFFLLPTIYPDFPNIVQNNFIRALLQFSFSFYLEVFQIIMGNKQLLFFQNVLRFRWVKTIFSHFRVPSQKGPQNKFPNFSGLGIFLIIVDMLMNSKKQKNFCCNLFLCLLLFGLNALDYYTHIEFRITHTPPSKNMDPLRQWNWCCILLTLSDNFFHNWSFIIQVLQSVLYCWSIKLSESIYFDILCKIISTWIHTVLHHSENKWLETYIGRFENTSQWSTLLE